MTEIGLKKTEIEKTNQNFGYQVLQARCSLINLVIFSHNRPTRLNFI
jgi:hypothetical protein